jgi:hypothetical protein
MPNPLPLPLRWLRRRPQVEGVYVARYRLTDRPMVAYFDPKNDYAKFSWNGDDPNAATWSMADPEWWYCDGDASGLPKRADAIWSKP